MVIRRSEWEKQSNKQPFSGLQFPRKVLPCQIVIQKHPFQVLCCLLNNESNVENKTMRKQNYKKTELGNNHVHNVYALIYTKFFHTEFLQSFLHLEYFTQFSFFVWNVRVTITFTFFTPGLLFYYS